MKKNKLTLSEVSLHTPNPAHLRAQQQLRAQVFKPKKGKGSFKRNKKVDDA